MNNIQLSKMTWHPQEFIAKRADGSEFNVGRFDVYDYKVWFTIEEASARTGLSQRAWQQRASKKVNIVNGSSMMARPLHGGKPMWLVHRSLHELLRQQHPIPAIQVDERTPECSQVDPLAKLKRGLVKKWRSEYDFYKGVKTERAIAESIVKSARRKYPFLDITVRSLARWWQLDCRGGEDALIDGRSRRNRVSASKKQSALVVGHDHF